MSARARSAPQESARAGLATAAIMVGTVAAHTWAGGELPSWPWTGLVAMLVLAATRAVFRGQVSARVMVVGIGAAQLALHLLLSSMASQPTHHMAAHGAPVMAWDIGWQMAGAHVLSTVLTVAVWSTTARALHAVTALPAQPRLAVPGRRAVVAAGIPAVRTVASWRSGAPRRGPPRQSSLRCA